MRILFMCSPTTPLDSYSAASAAGTSFRSAFENATDVTTCRNNIRNEDDGIFNIIFAEKLTKHTKCFADTSLAALKCVKGIYEELGTPLVGETLEKVTIVFNYALALNKASNNFISAKNAAAADDDPASGENLVVAALSVFNAWASATVFGAEANAKLLEIFQVFSNNYISTHDLKSKETALAIQAHLIDAMIFRSPLEEAGAEYALKHPEFAAKSKAESAGSQSSADTPTAPHNSTGAASRARRRNRRAAAAAEALRSCDAPRAQATTAAAVGAPPVADSADRAPLLPAAGGASSTDSSELDPTE